MRMRRTTVLLALLIAAWPRPCRGFGNGDRGTSGAQVLKIAPGARPAAMGEAFAGLADDVHAAYYNPAGLGGLKKVEVTAMHESRFQGVAYDYAAVAAPMLSWVDTKQPRNAYGVLALSIYSLSTSDIERRGTTETDEAVDTFGASDLAYALSYGYALRETPLSFGVTAKAVDSRIDSAKASSFAADAGVLAKGKRLSGGAGVRNLGTKQRFVSEADPLPLTAFLGASYRFSKDFVAALEADLPRDRSLTVGGGAEYRRAFGDKLSGAARAGYNSRNRDAGGLAGFSMGFGLGVGSFDFDFAWVPFGDLGSSFKYSLVVKF